MVKRTDRPIFVLHNSLRILKLNIFILLNANKLKKIIEINGNESNQKNGCCQSSVNNIEHSERHCLSKCHFCYKEAGTIDTNGECRMIIMFDIPHW